MVWLLVNIFLALTLVKCYPAGNGMQYLYESLDGNPLRSFGRDRALLETESKVSRLDSAYSYAQNHAASFHNPQPLVDTIAEHEKYGNDGGIHRQVSQGLINSFEGVSHLANNIIDAPFNKAQEISRSATAKLNDIGAYLVGL